MTAGASAPLTFVLVTFNSADVLGSALESVRQQTEASLIVVDNASSDETAAVAEAHGATVIQTGSNLGYGAAVNIGVAAAASGFVVVLNPDARVKRCSIDSLSDLSPIGLVALTESIAKPDEERLEPLLKPDLPWPAEVAWSLSNWLLIPREIDASRPKLSRRERMDGAAFLVDRDEFISIGGFNERLFLYYEDTELTATYRDSGLPLRVSDVVVVEHDGSGSSPRLHERVVAWSILSQIEGVAIRHGSPVGNRAAKLHFSSLRAIARLGALCSSVPYLGQRAEKKRESALEILRHLELESSSPPRAGAFPEAARRMTGLFGRVDS